MDIMGILAIAVAILLLIGVWYVALVWLPDYLKRRRQEKAPSQTDPAPKERNPMYRRLILLGEFLFATGFLTILMGAGRQILGSETGESFFYLWAEVIVVSLVILVVLRVLARLAYRPRWRQE